MIGIKGTDFYLYTFKHHEDHLIHRVQEEFGVEVSHMFRRELSNLMYGASKTMLKGCVCKLDRIKELYEKERRKNEELTQEIARLKELQPV